MVLIDNGCKIRCHTMKCNWGQLGGISYLYWIHNTPSERIIDWHNAEETKLWWNFYHTMCVIYLPCLTAATASFYI